MRGAVVEPDGVVIQDVPVPEPAGGQARIRIHAAGVCHSDVHLARQDWGFESPAIGHEAIGSVDALGPGAERYVAVGDRVILGLGGAAAGWCGSCEYCLRGEPMHCAEVEVLMGAFAEQFCAPAKGLVKLPDTISDEEASLACGGLTAYGAVKKLLKHQVLPGRRIAILGAAGGLGHYAVQLANEFGYRVIGIDAGDERLAFVESLGAEIVASVDEAPEIVEELGGVDASLVFPGRVAAFQLGLSILRHRGLFVAVGIPPASDGKFEIEPFDFFYREPTLIFSVVGTVQDMRELIELAAAGRVKTHIGRLGKLSELPSVLDELEAGKYLGRAVITDLRG